MYKNILLGGASIAALAMVAAIPGATPAVAAPAPTCAITGTGTSSVPNSGDTLVCGSSITSATIINNSAADNVSVTINNSANLESTSTPAIVLGNNANLRIESGSTLSVNALGLGKGSAFQGGTGLTALIMSGATVNGQISGGSGSAVTLAGTINSVFASAVAFTGDNNRLILNPGYSISGAFTSVVGGMSGATNTVLELGGTGTGAFDTGSIGAMFPTVFFSNFAKFEKTGTSNWTLTGTPNQTTPWTIKGGTLSIASGTALGTTGTLTFDGGSLATTATTGIGTRNVVVASGGGFFVPSGGTSVSVDGVISGSGALATGGSGSLVLTGTNTYSGTLTITAGSKLFLSETGTIVSTNLVDNGTFDISGMTPSAATIASLSGSGAVVLGAKSLTVTNGSGIYTGTMTGTGPISLTGGQLSINGTSASVITIANGGTLKGIGTVGGFTASSGGTVAPGNSIGTLNVAGNISFVPGSIYQVEVDAAGNADKIAATGTASITGGTVQVLASAGTYAQATPYTIITATGGVTGGFTSVTSNLTFLTPSLSYTANSVVLTLTQTVTFPSVAGTPNQVASGTALQAGGTTGGALYTALLNTTSVAIARSAFDASSGEIYASLMGAQFEGAISTRRAMLDRMRGMDPKDPVTGISFWGAVSGDTGTINADGNAAAVSHNGINLSLGADTALTPNVRVGIDTGYSTNHAGISARASKAKVTSGHVGGYANGNFDNVKVRAGFGYGFGDASVTRTVAFTGFTDATSSSQGADTFQIFAEAGYAFAMPGYTLEPFAEIDWTSLNMGAFREAGGSAALAGAGKRMDQTLSTFGLALSMDGTIAPSVRAGLQHALTRDTASRTLSFVSSGQSFTVLGAPLDADRAVIDANLTFHLGGAKLTAGYSGAFGSHTTDHAIKALAVVDF